MLDLTTLRRHHGWIALGFVLLAAAPAPLMAAVAALHLTTTNRFFVAEDRVIVRIAVIVGISALVAGAMLCSSALWHTLIDSTGHLSGIGKNLPTNRIDDPVREAMNVFAALLVALLLADALHRFVENRITENRLVRYVALSAEFYTSLYFALTVSEVFLLAATTGLYREPFVVAFIFVASLRALAIPIYETFVLLRKVAEYPRYEMERSIDFVSANLADPFAWTPILTKWIAILMIVAFCGALAKRMVKSFVP